jgi:hypothetical protein
VTGQKRRRENGGKNMKKLSSLVIFFAIITFNLSSVFALEELPGFTLKRLVISKDVQYREPVGIGENFSKDTEKVYCFLDTRNIAEDTTISFVWYFEGKEMANVNLPLLQGPRWRTYSSKRLAGLTGDWKVELQDAEGTVVKTVEFTVE